MERRKFLGMLMTGVVITSFAPKILLDSFTGPGMFRDAFTIKLHSDWWMPNEVYKIGMDSWFAGHDGAEMFLWKVTDNVHEAIRIKVELDDNEGEMPPMLVTSHLMNEKGYI